MAVCSFLCFCRLFSTAEAAVYMFSMKRCPPGIWPSHKRYHASPCGMLEALSPVLWGCRSCCGSWETGGVRGRAVGRVVWGGTPAP